MVKVQNQATLDGSPVAQAIIKFMEDKDEYTGTSSDLHKKLEGVSESLGVSVVRDKAWPKSARWLWHRIKEVLPLLVAAGIEATREHTDKGTSIALRKAPRNDVSIVRDEESSEDNAKGSDISASLLSGSNVRDEPNVRVDVRRYTANHAGSDVTDNTDIRYGKSWQSDPMRHYRRGGAA